MTAVRLAGIQSEQKSPLPRGRGRLQSKRVLVVQICFDRCRAIEVARGANGFLPAVGAHETGGFIPVEVVDGVRVFGVWRVIFASEDLSLLRHPSSSESPNRAGLSVRTDLALTTGVAAGAGHEGMVV